MCNSQKESIRSQPDQIVKLSFRILGLIVNWLNNVRDLALGLVLKNIEELAVNVGNYCADLEHQEFNPPLAFVASWQKTSWEKVG